ncbi:type II secretion system F family protein [Caulobacter endophyticus]|uniref:Secretion system protein n=1 Tax=Caulobacter endophyticus TaxID=2172652 RepID=A0A2T9JH29_9CAUL|nr:type II secretion system F family protein [Caulobacter endophyticus]PVM83010.1 secretion system protein [Caulobacter endophyticus]
MQGLLFPMALVLAFVAAVLAGQTIFGLLLSAREQTQRVNRRLTLMAAGMSQDKVYESLVRDPRGSWIDRTPYGALHGRATLYLRQSGLTAGPLQVLGVVAAAAAGLWLLALVFLRGQPVETPVSQVLVTAVGATAVSSAVAAIWIVRRHAARLAKLEEQLPLALDVMIRALRAGHPVISAVGLVTQEMPDPIGTEFGLVLDETTYGVEFRDALSNLARRTGSPDVAFFAVSIAIQSETGGNLAEILAGLATVIRGRASLAKRIRALSSEGRMSALILSLLPLFCVGVVSVFRPEFYTTKFSDPAFWPVVSGVVVLYLIGQLMIRRIVTFKY